MNAEDRILKSLRVIITECLPSRCVTTNEDPYALFVSALNMTGTGRYHVNSRIVVVGCSSTAIAFLEALIGNQDLEYGVKILLILIFLEHILNKIEYSSS